MAQRNCVEPGQQLPLGIDLLTGSFAGGIAGAVTTPLDVMKTLLQTQQSGSGSSGGGGKGTKKSSGQSTTTAVSTGSSKPSTPTLHQPKHYSGIIDGLKWNYKHLGVGGLFLGLGPRVFWTSLQSAIMFVIYEQVLHLEASMRERDEWPPTVKAKQWLQT